MLTLPDLIQGQWSSAIILTYGADLAFYEGRLLQQLAQVPLRLVLADERQLAAKFAELGGAGQGLRHANRTYAVTPIRHPRAAHAKMILLVGTQKGLLIVGSGNLGYSGYASPGELWNVFRYHDDDPTHLSEFRAARSLIDGLDARDLLDQPARELLPDIWGTAPWLAAAAGTDGAIRHNLEVPLIDQLADATTESVEELIAHAPFHDPDCSALDHLIKRFRPRRLRVLVSCGTSVDPDALARVIAPLPAVTIEWIEVAGDETTYIHAKWVHLRTRDKEILLTGSANLSRSALLRPTTTGNIETGVISTGPPGAFDEFYRHLETEIVDVGKLDLKFEPSRPQESVSHSPVVRWTRLDGHRLTLMFDRPITDHPGIMISDIDGDLTWVAESVDGATMVLELHPDSVVRVAAGGALTIRWVGGDEELAFSWPYQLETIRGRLQKAEEKAHLHRIGDLPEHDAELRGLLTELESTLIFDPLSTWRVVRPNHEPPEADDAETIRLDDLDWDRLRRDPRFTAYLPRRAAPGVAPTDIQIILAGITGRLGELGLEPNPDSEPSDEEESLAIEEDVEETDAERSDETTDDDELASHHPLSVTTRTRKAFTRFIKRYAAALNDAKFLDQLGPTTVATNAVVFTVLLRGLLQRDAVDPNHAVRAQIATWRLLWGDLTNPGLLQSVHQDHRSYIERILTHTKAQAGAVQDLLAVDVSALDREDRIAFRNQVRHLLVDPDFDMLDALLAVPAPSEQAQHSNARLLEQQALHTEPDELIEMVVSPMQLRAGQARWERAKFVGDQTLDLLVIDAPVEHLDVNTSVQALQRLALAYRLSGSEDSYLRIRFLKNGKDVAFWDARAQKGLVWINNVTTPIDSLEVPLPDWLRKLQELQSLWDMDVPVVGV